MNKNPSVSQPLPTLELVRREMQTADLNQVLTIERNAQLVPWSRLSFEESLNNHQLCRVIENEHEIFAFHVVCPVLDELHILNLAVATQHQGQGLGHLLMRDILSLAETQHLVKIFLEVRASNTRAQSLYQKWQFKQIALRKLYYRSNGNQREDALVYVRIVS